MQYRRDWRWRLASFLFVNTCIFNVAHLVFLQPAFSFKKKNPVYLLDWRNLAPRFRRDICSDPELSWEIDWFAKGYHVRSRSGQADDKIEWVSIRVRWKRFLVVWKCRRGERASGEMLASIQRTYERTCRHRRSYIEISAKETKARGTTREIVLREAPRRAGKKLIRFCKPATGTLRFQKWFPIYISTDLLLS